MDKASIIGDAILYVQDLKMQAKKLNAEIAGFEASLAGSEMYQESIDNPVKIQVARKNHPIYKKILQVKINNNPFYFYDSDFINLSSIEIKQYLLLKCKLNISKFL